MLTWQCFALYSGLEFRAGPRWCWKDQITATTAIQYYIYGYLWDALWCPYVMICYDVMIYIIYIYIVCVIMCVYMRVYLRACVCVCVRIICQNMWYHQWPICVIMIHRCFLCPGKSWPKACGLDTSPIGTPSWPSCCSIDLDYPYSVDALHLEYSPPYTYT